MCQRLRVAIKVGTLDGQDFYQSGDAQDYTFVGIKGTIKNGAAFALFGNVGRVSKTKIFCNTFALLRLMKCHYFQVMSQLKEMFSGFNRLEFPAVPKSMIGSVSELLKEMGHTVHETKCYTYVLKDVSKLVHIKYIKTRG